MSELLKSINEVEGLIRQLHKMESKMRSGQFIDAHRDLNRIIGTLEAEKEKIIKNAEKVN